MSEDELCDMFPQIDRSIVRAVADSNQQDIHSAVQQLLVISTTTSTTPEDIANQLLEQITTQVNNIALDHIEPALNTLTNHLHTLPYKQFKTALKTLAHCLDNVLLHPQDKKFCTLKLTNQTFMEKLGNHKGAIQLLKTVGFVQSLDGESLEINPVDVEAVSIALALTRERLEIAEANAVSLQPAGKSLEAHKASNDVMNTKKPKKNNIKGSKITSELLRELHLSRMNKLDKNANESKLPPTEVIKRSNLKKVSQSNVPEEEPPSIFPSGKREFNLRDIEELRKHDILKAAKDGTRNTFLDQLGQQALVATNEFRKEHGLSELLWHQGLADIGKVHSARMGTFKVPIGHDGFAQRVKQYPFPYSNAAENVAMLNNILVSDMPREAVRGWINSP